MAVKERIQYHVERIYPESIETARLYGLKVGARSHQ